MIGVVNSVSSFKDDISRYALLETDAFRKRFRRLTNPVQVDRVDFFKSHNYHTAQVYQWSSL